VYVFLQLIILVLFFFFIRHNLKEKKEKRKKNEFLDIWHYWRWTQNTPSSDED
jgi:hypothetical protein